MDEIKKLKNYSVTGYKAVGEDTIQIIASDGSVDRDGDVINPAGWQCENWLKSGSLLYGHDPSSPMNVIGKPESAEVKNGQLIVSATLAAAGTSPMHDCIRALLEQKILRGVSVGFKSSDWEKNDTDGMTFKSAELLEVSLVPVPANPNAQVLMKSFNLSKDEQDILIEDEKKWDPEKDEDRRKNTDRRLSDRRKAPESNQEEETNSVEPTEDDKKAKFAELIIKTFGNKI